MKKQALAAGKKKQDMNKKHWFVLIFTLQNNSFSCDVGDWKHCIKYVTGKKSSLEWMSDESHKFAQAKDVKVHH